MVVDPCALDGGGQSKGWVGDANSKAVEPGGGRNLTMTKVTVVVNILVYLVARLGYKPNYSV